MEGSSRRRQPALSLHREFVGSRLEEQILKQAFALVMAVHRSERMDDQPTKSAADHPSVSPVRFPGACES
jgi:hypothetical protein